MWPGQNEKKIAMLKEKEKTHKNRTVMTRDLSFCVCLRGQWIFIISTVSEGICEQCYVPYVHVEIPAAPFKCSWGHYQSRLPFVNGGSFVTYVGYSV